MHECFTNTRSAHSLNFTKLPPYIPIAKARGFTAGLVKVFNGAAVAGATNSTYKPVYKDFWKTGFWMLLMFEAKRKAKQKGLSKR